MVYVDNGMEIVSPGDYLVDIFASLVGRIPGFLMFGLYRNGRRLDTSMSAFAVTQNIYDYITLSGIIGLAQGDILQLALYNTETTNEVTLNTGGGVGASLRIAKINN